jgi:hypothetical protein
LPRRSQKPIGEWDTGRFTSEWQGQTFEQWGTVVLVDAPNRLAYSLFAPRPDLEDKPENYFTMTYILDSDEGATTLTILQEDPRPGAEAPSRTRRTTRCWRH